MCLVEAPTRLPAAPHSVQKARVHVSCMSCASVDRGRKLMISRLGQVPVCTTYRIHKTANLELFRAPRSPLCPRSDKNPPNSSTLLGTRIDSSTCCGARPSTLPQHWSVRAHFGRMDLLRGNNTCMHRITEVATVIPKNRLSKLSVLLPDSAGLYLRHSAAIGALSNPRVMNSAPKRLHVVACSS